MAIDFTTTAATAETANGAYLTALEAASLGAGHPDLVALLASSGATLAALLLVASIDIDAAGPYQGRRYDLTATQVREFPRVPYGEPVANQLPTTDFSNVAFSTEIWDWDATNNVAIVPAAVKLACLYQAAWLLLPEHAARLERIKSGLKGQGVGSGSESLATMAELAAAGGVGLCRRAAAMMEMYRLKSGRLL